MSHGKNMAMSSTLIYIYIYIYIVYTWHTSGPRKLYVQIIFHYAVLFIQIILNKFKSLDICQVEGIAIYATWQKYGNVFYFNIYIDIDI